MTERHLIAYAILTLLLAAAAATVLWRRGRRARRGSRHPVPHLRIDLIGADSEEPPPVP